MGLFDKKYCDVCGEKIGLLGNKKLEDGNLCKNCAKKLSPFFSERRNSTVEEIKAQLAYREQNEQQVARFNPTKSYGNGYKKVYIDMNQQKFIVTSDSTWQDSNPDVIDFSQVTAVNTDIEEHESEIYYEDSEGREQSYNPRRYEYEYEFTLKIIVDSPWFSEIELELSDSSRRPESKYSPVYRDLEMMQQELVSVLTGAPMQTNYNQPQNMGYQQNAFNQPMQDFGRPQNMGYVQPTSQPQYANYPMNQNGYNQPQQNFAQPQAQAGAVWICQNCGTQNSNRFCQGCGSPQPQMQNTRVMRCDKCGWTLSQGQQAPKFCPQCGDPVDFNDMM